MAIGTISRTNLVTDTVADVDDINPDMNTSYDKINEIITQTNTNTDAIAGIDVATSAALKVGILCTRPTASTYSVAADTLSLQDVASSAWDTVIETVGVTIDMETNGANGLDSGTWVADKFYSVWVIYNGLARAGLASLSVDNPTMPSGYTKRRRVAWMRTDAGPAILEFTHAKGSSWFINITATARIDTITIPADGDIDATYTNTHVPEGTTLCRIGIASSNIQHDTFAYSYIVSVRRTGDLDGAIEVNHMSLQGTSQSNSDSGEVELGLDSSMQFDLRGSLFAATTWSGIISVNSTGWYDNA